MQSLDNLHTTNSNVGHMPFLLHHGQVAANSYSLVPLYVIHSKAIDHDHMTFHSSANSYGAHQLINKNDLNRSSLPSSSDHLHHEENTSPTSCVQIEEHILPHSLQLPDHNSMYASNLSEIAHPSMGFNSCTSHLEEQNFHIKKQQQILPQSLGPHQTLYTSCNIKEIDDINMSFTPSSFGVIKVKLEDESNFIGLTSSNMLQEEKRREIHHNQNEDPASAQFCSGAGRIGVSTPTIKQDANNDGEILNFKSLSSPKPEVSKESLYHANPSRTSICKASKSPSKKKTHQKQIICVPVASGSHNKSPGECLHSDSWAWRKYGQKPIKGSPYPRGYYRCSTCKGCTARKQVERSRSDPNMLVITYTSGHNHTWQANQKTRQKLEDGNPLSIDPCENFTSIDGSSIQHGDNTHVKTLSTDPPYNSMLEDDPPCIKDKYDIGNLQDEGPEKELDYFGLLEELPSDSSLTMLESTKSPLLEHEDPITIVHSNVVDPFNLFNWSSNIGLNYYSTTS